MDPKEARGYVGYNVHFNPKMNPNPKPSTSPPNQHWWNKIQSGQTKPLKIERQMSNTSDTSSPVGSPTFGPASPPTFEAIDLGSKPHMPQPYVYKQFHFAN